MGLPIRTQVNGCACRGKDRRSEAEKGCLQAFHKPLEGLPPVLHSFSLVEHMRSKHRVYPM